MEPLIAKIRLTIDLGATMEVSALAEKFSRLGIEHWVADRSVPMKTYWLESTYEPPTS